MPPRALGLAILTLLICVVLAVLMLALHSAELDQSVAQTPHGIPAGQTPGVSGAVCRGERAAQPWVADLPLEAAWISQC